MAYRTHPTKDSFRCPDCWAPFQSEFAVKNHVHAMDGKCFDMRPEYMQKSIRKYHDTYEIPHSRRFGNDDIEVIE